MTITEQMLRIRYPWINTENNWIEMVTKLRRYKPRLCSYAVKWVQPKQSGLKCNTDGACEGNLGCGLYVFAMWNRDDNLVHAHAEYLGMINNMEAEKTAILETLRFCVSKSLHVDGIRVSFIGDGKNNKK